MPKKIGKIKLPFGPKKEIFRWGPVPGKFFYNSVFTEVHYKHFRKRYSENWAQTLWLFKGGRMLWLNDSAEIQNAGRSVFLRYLLRATKRRKIYAEWRSYVKSLSGLYKKIDSLDLSSISNSLLLKLWNDFHKLYIKFWVTGSVPELANYGSVPYLEKKLLPHIPNDESRASALEALTAPTRLSFYQEEEINLLKTDDIVNHQRQYFWLKNSYAGTKVLPVIFFKHRKKVLNRDLKTDVAKKLKQFMYKKKEMQKEYKLTKEIMDIAEAVSNGVGWQDERKKCIFIALHYTDVLAKEVARRSGYRFQDFDNLWYFEVANIIRGKNFREIIKRRKGGFGVQFFHTCRMLSPKETVYVWKTYETKHADKEQTQVKGVIASKGNGKKVVGRARILFDPHKLRAFKKGEILLAPMTSPEYIFAMKIAGAIVTDTGGLTSHAAIVSRELGIPCLVGTKLATKIFKNGDMIEIDPQNGIAKKFES